MVVPAGSGMPTLSETLMPVHIAHAGGVEEKNAIAPCGFVPWSRADSVQLL